MFVSVIPYPPIPEYWFNSKFNDSALVCASEKHYSLRVHSSVTLLFRVGNKLLPLDESTMLGFSFAIITSLPSAFLSAFPA